MSGRLLSYGLVPTKRAPEGARRILERATGFEPADDGLGSHCLTTWRCPRLFEHSNTACPTRGVRAQFLPHKPQSNAHGRGREGHGAKTSRHLLTMYAIPARRGTPDLQEGNCKTRASHLQAPFATLSVHEGPHRKVNHMVARAPRQNAEVTKAKESTRHGLANKPGRCQLRGGDPIRGGVPLAAGHAGLLGGDRRAL